MAREAPVGRRLGLGGGDGMAIVKIKGEGIVEVKA